MAINFPSTSGQPTDGSFTHTHGDRTWSWNGKRWSSIITPSLSFDQQNKTLTLKNSSETTSVDLLFVDEQDLSETEQKYDNILDQSLDLDSEGQYTGVTAPENTVREDITNLEQNKISNSEKGSAGGVAELDNSGNLVQEKITSLTINGNILTYTDEQGVSTDIQLPYLDSSLETLTTLSLDSNDNLVYTDELGNSETITLPYMEPQDLSLDSNGDLVYLDQFGSQQTISLPSQTTEVSLDSFGNLVYTDEKGQDSNVDWDTKDAIKNFYINDAVLFFEKIDNSVLQIPLPHQESLINLQLDNGILTAEKLSSTLDPVSVDLSSILQENNTELFLSSDQENLIYIDETGSENIIPLPDDRLTSLDIDITGTHPQGQEKHSLLFLDEADVLNTIDLPQNILTSLSSDSAGLVYVDENGQSSNISFPNTLTELYVESDSTGRSLMYQDENGDITEISVIANVRIQTTAPTDPSPGDLYFHNDANSYDSNLKIWDGYSWEPAIVSASKLQNESNSITLSNEDGEIDVSASLRVNGNLYVSDGDLFLYPKTGGENSKINFGEGDYSTKLTIKDYDKSDPNVTPRMQLEKENNIVVVSNSSSDLLDSSSVESPNTIIVDTSKTHHFIDNLNDTDIMLYWGNYVGQEIHFHVVNGSLTPASNPSINVWLAKYPSNFSMNSFVDYAGFHGENSNLGDTLDSTDSDWQNGYSVVSSSQWTEWGLYNIRPLHRNFDETQPAGSQYKWTFLNESSVTYSCIWDGSGWILNNGTVLSSSATPTVPAEADYSIPAHIWFRDFGG